MLYIRYLVYVLRHKWFVFLECARVGLWRRGLVHDLSKFLPSEFIPYARHFYGGRTSQRDSSGYYKPTDTGDPAFDLAWLAHQNRNDHHWQWWVIPANGGGLVVYPMSWSARLEMVCDWRGAARAQGTRDVCGWYTKHKDQILLAPATRSFVEAALSAGAHADCR